METELICYKGSYCNAKAGGRERRSDFNKLSKSKEKAGMRTVCTMYFPNQLYHMIRIVYFHCDHTYPSLNVQKFKFGCEMDTRIEPKTNEDRCISHSQLP